MVVQAVEAAPHNADCLGSYAVFLHGQKRDDDTTAVRGGQLHAR